MVDAAGVSGALLLGTSYGGYLALRAALRAPGHWHGLILDEARSMRRVLVTCRSGTGRSSALAALEGLGFHVVDTDEPGWTEWSDQEDGYVWLEEPISGLLARDDEPSRTCPVRVGEGEDV